MSLLSNIINNYNFLQADFTGISFSFIFSKIFLNFLISFVIVIIYFLIGDKIRKFLLRNAGENLKDFNHLINIALGFIFVGTGISILGLFSKLYPNILFVYLLIVILLSIFPAAQAKNNLKKLYLSIKDFSLRFKKDKLVFVLTFLFILITLTKLISPEIREDQYHTDLPKAYLANHTTMLPAGDVLKVLPSPQLTEMTYLVTVALNNKEASRYISFIFYLLILMTFFSFSKKGFSNYSMLIFASSPIVIKLASTAYVDIPFMFCFLLSFALLVSNKTNLRSMLTSGVLFGGVLAGKLWTIAFIPVPTLFLLTLRKKKSLAGILVFILSALAISFVWYLRSYLLTGSIFYPAFSSVQTGSTSYVDSIGSFIGINVKVFNFDNLKELSPLFFLGFVFSLFNINTIVKNPNLRKMTIFAGIFFAEYAFIQYYLARYLLGIYPFLVIFGSVGISLSVYKYKLLKYLIAGISLLMIVYYLINSLLVLPYGLGWANENKYLTRVLSRDNSSYYDFDKRFDKFIDKNDYVATYGIYSYYYANFKYIDTNYLYYKKNKDIKVLKKEGVNKLFIKGGDIRYFCAQMEIKNCNLLHYSLISKYELFPTYYLYGIK